MPWKQMPTVEKRTVVKITAAKIGVSEHLCSVMPSLRSDTERKPERGHVRPGTRASPRPGARGQGNKISITLNLALALSSHLNGKRGKYCVHSTFLCNL